MSEIQRAELEALFIKAAVRGGRIQLQNKQYELSEPLTLKSSSTHLAGETWCYSSDPNGVFEAYHGTKLRLCGQASPAVYIGGKTVCGGVEVSDLGFQGDIRGMDTRPLLKLNDPKASVGLCFREGRVDQGEFYKLSFCGLAAAISACEDAELDACSFDRLNTDGCGIGIRFAPRASYYTRVRRSVIADTPSYGFYADGRGASIHHLEISDCCFVRNCGANTEGDANAAVYFRGISDCTVRNCTFDCAGTFWYYEDDATQNNQRKPSRTEAFGLLIEGNKNIVMNNAFSHSSAASVVVSGDGNVLLGNIVDGDVRISGNGNSIHNLIFTKPQARLYLCGEAIHSTQLVGIPEERIVRL